MKSPQNNQSNISLTELNNSLEFNLGLSRNSDSFIKVYQPIKTPRSDIEETISLTHSMSSTIFKVDCVLTFDSLPKLSETKMGKDFTLLFQKKCAQCSQICNFETTAADLIEAKSEMLIDILEIVKDAKYVKNFQDIEYKCFYDFISANIIRPLPDSPLIWFSVLFMNFLHDKVEEISWPHLSIVYDILIEFLNNPSFSTQKSAVYGKELIRNVISLFASPDGREREKVGIVYHSLYKLFFQYRSESRFYEKMFLLQSLTNPFLTIGNNELLQISLSVINGFQKPFTKEHLSFFFEVLIPLHRSQNIYLFHSSLVACTEAYVSNDPTLVKHPLSAIIRYFPLIESTSLLFFIKEIGMLLKYATPESIKDISVKLCKAIAFCDKCLEFAIAEAGILMIFSDYFLKLFSGKEYLQILVPAIFYTATTHWCDEVKALAVRALRTLRQLDEEVFNCISVNLKKAESQRVFNEIERGKAWTELAVAQGDEAALRQIPRLFVGCEELKKII